MFIHSCLYSVLNVGQLNFNIKGAVYNNLMVTKGERFRVACNEKWEIDEPFNRKKNNESDAMRVGDMSTVLLKIVKFELHGPILIE